MFSTKYSSRTVWQKFKNTVGFSDKWLLLVGVPILGLVLPYFLRPEYLEMSFADKAAQSLIATGFVSLLWSIDRFVCIIAHKKFDSPKQVAIRIVYQFTLYLSSVVIIHFLSQLLFSLSDAKICQMCVDNSDRILLTSTITTIIIGTLYEAMFFFNRWKDSLVINERLQQEYDRTQLQSLQTQINPHFLFNSLNTLAAIIPDNPETAVKFVEKLSFVYRNILELKDEKLVTIKRELETTQAFIYLLNIRFGDNIQTKIDLDLDKDKILIAPMTLQLLIENAIKHNVTSNKHPLEISITNDDAYIRVCNTIRLKEQQIESTRTGLSNIRNRYELLNVEPVKVNEIDGTFCVEVPIIKEGA